MATLNHLYMTVQGTYEATDLAEESWQYGVRLYADLNPIPDVGSPSGAFDVAADTLSASDANWSVTSNWLGEGGATDLDPADYLLDNCGFIKAFHESATSYISGDAIISTVSLYAIGDDGKVVSTDYGPAKAVATPSATVDGAATGTLLPVQCSVVASLRTINTTRRGRGRCYLPQMATALTSTGTGLVGNTIRQNIATNFAAVLTGCTVEGVSDLKIAPVVIGDPWTSYFKITTVKVGNQVDTQRRRRRSVVETYSSASV